MNVLFNHLLLGDFLLHKNRHPFQVPIPMSFISLGMKF